MRKKNNAAIAALTAFLLLASGCTSTDEAIVETIPPMETAWDESEMTEETTVPSETSEASETEEHTKKTAPETDISEEDSSDMSEGSETDEEAESETEESAAQQLSWSETNTSGSMMIKRSCYAYEHALSDSTPLSKYSKGDVVEISALTDTGYYKLKSGGYVSISDLTDLPDDYDPNTEPEAAETTAPDEELETDDTTKRTRRTTVTEEEPELFIDDDDDSWDIDDSAPGTTTAHTTAVTTTTSATTVQTEAPSQPADTGSAKDFSSRYGYNQLTEDEKALYADIVSCVNNFEKTVSYTSNIGSNDAVKVYMMVFNEEPDLFWMGGSVSISGKTLTINYKNSNKSEIENMKNLVEAEVNNVMAKVNSKSSTFDKLKVMYDYVILNNTFSMSSEGYNASIYNAFTHKGQLQCAGYAKAIQYLCDKAGIECTIVVGTNSEGASHAWNVVYCDDGYYNLDATWGDPVDDRFKSNFIKYTYFLVPDSWIHNVSHFNINAYSINGSMKKLFTPPACTKTSQNYFKHLGLEFSSLDAAENAIYRRIEEAVANGEGSVEILVTSDELFKELTSDASVLKFQKFAKEKSSKVSMMLRHTADKYKNLHIVYYDIIY